MSKLKVDEIEETSSGVGVTIENVLNKDGLVAANVLGTEIDTSTGAVLYDVTGITSAVKEIVITLSGVGASGTSDFMIQIGTSGGIVTTGYASGVTTTQGTGNAQQTSTVGFNITASVAASDVRSGNIILKLVNSSAFKWAQSGTLSNSTGSGVSHTSGGNLTLASEITQIRLTTVGGSDTFDEGSFNIQFSG